jgi:hypothetical protein
MPSTVGFYLLTQIGATALAASAAATYLVGLAVTTFVTDVLIGALSPKPAAAAQRGYETNVLGPALDHTIIYGKTKVGGVVVYNEATGTDNKFLHRVIAVAGHEVESFERIYIDDAYIDFSNLGASGNVPTVFDPDGTTSDRYNDKLRIQVAYGTPTQEANADLVTASDGKWTNSCKLSGIAYIYVRLAFDADVYPNGIPTFTAEIKGKKVYDPRTNTTGWSDNPALCVRDYLTSTGYGLGEIADNIDDDLTRAAADVCDQTVFGKTRYTTNGSFTTGATPYDLISSILPSMGGSLWYAQGKWRVKPAYWTAPVMFLDEDDLRSSISVSTRHSRRDNFNVIKGKFSGPDTNWQMVDYKEVKNESAAGTFVVGLPYSISEVGTTNFVAIGASSNTVGEVFVATGAGTGTGVADLNLGVDNGLASVADVDLLFTDNMKEARRLGRITLERNRQQLTIQASFGLKTLGLQVGDNVYITNNRFGWTNKAFEILSWNFGLTDGLDLQTEMTLRETAEAAFDEVDDAAIYEADNTNLPSPFFVPVPSLDAAVITTTINEDGTAIPAIDFSWSVSNSEVVDYYDFQWKLTGASNYSSIATEEPRFTLAPALSNVSYNYRVRAVNTLGIKSQYASSPSPANTGDDTTIPNAPTGLSASAGYGAVTVTWTAPTTNVGGSPLKDLFQYEIYRGTSSNPTVKVGRVAGEIFTDGGLSDNTTYYYRVKAVDFTGNSSAYSNQDDATTNPTLQDGASVLVVYADDAIGTNQSLSVGSRQYVQYYEYVGTTPSLPVSGTFVKFIGADGQSIWPIYATSAAGANQSFSPTGKDYVTFYESLTQPTLPVSGQTFVPYVGSDGETGASTNVIFIRSATQPATPAPSSGIPSGWYDSPPAGTELVWASSGVKVVGSTTFTWGTPWQIDGASIAEVSIYRKNSSAGGTGGSYNFVTQTLTPPTSWSVNPPALTANGDTIYRKSGVTSGSATQTSATVSYGTAVVYANRTDGTDGARGAGRWNIGVTTLPTTSSGANTAFVAAIGQPVDRDQAWFYTGTQSAPTSQSVWIYNAGTLTWVEQTEVIDGNLLVTGTVTANAIDADAITGKNVKVGDLVTNGTAVPTSGSGALMKSTGDFTFGNTSKYVAWDTSAGSLVVQGDIINVSEFEKSAYSGGWSSFAASITLTNKFNELGGAGLYRIFIGGGGGGGSSKGLSGGGRGKGGSSGAGAYFTFNWNGSSSVVFTSGSGGAGGSGSASASGSGGGSSLFVVGGSTLVTVAGGNGANYTTTSATAGPSAPSTPVDSRISEFSGISGGAGGSSTSGGGTGGGGLAAFSLGASSCRGGNSTSNNGTAGGDPFGRGGDSGSISVTGPSTPEDSNGFVIVPSSGRLLFGSSAGYFGGSSGNVSLSGGNGTGFLAGCGSSSSVTNEAGSGGLLAAGGGSRSSAAGASAIGGAGGPSGGGGGAYTGSASGGVPSAGSGGNGVIFFKKL